MSVVPEHIFREYDIRGLVGKEVNTETAKLIGQAYGTLIQPISGKEIMVGSDNRPSSEGLKRSFIKGLIQTGCNVTDIGLCTTPMLYFAVYSKDFDGGISITGSHNPSEYNGFKLTSKKAEPIYGMEIQDMLELIQKGQFRKGKGSVKNAQILDDYLEMLLSKIKLDKKMKVVIDCGNGAAAVCAVQFFEKLGCDVVPLYCVSDGTFPNHLPDPTKEEYTAELAKKVKETHADLGIGFDGDADRLGVVDEKGNLIYGDRLMLLFVKEILEKHPHSKILFEVKCSQTLYDTIDNLGGHPIFWKTGHSLIKSKMKQEKAIFAGEMSGHMFFADDFYGYDDAFYAAGRLLMILSKTDKKLSELLDAFPKHFSSKEYRVDCPDKIKFIVVDQIADFFNRIYPNSVTVDGIRIQFEDGWGLVRASNTQPKLILRFEAFTQEGLDRIIKIVTKKLKEFDKVDLGELGKVVK
ncbi:MAG: phosphomannomutase/phosphoglucomutase [Candidatus Diapherotrites archaeon]